MNKVLLNNAIKNCSVFEINNGRNRSISKLYYHSINGEICFLNARKIKIDRTDFKQQIADEYFENTILEITFQYTNLCKACNDIDIFINNGCFLVDEEGYKFEVISMNEGLTYDEGWEKYGIGKEEKLGYFIPKVKQIEKLYFLIPNDEASYFLQIEHSNFKEKMLI